MTTADELPTEFDKRRRCEIVVEAGRQCTRLDEVIMCLVNKDTKKKGKLVPDAVRSLFPERFEDKLCLALAQVALNDFNFKQDVFYEHVNVVESLIISSSSANSTITLRITFQASLPASTQTTFVTKIYLSFPHPTLSNVEIALRSVKIKGEGNDYEDNNDDELVDNLSASTCYTDIYPEIDSESHVREPCGENLSQFDNDKHPEQNLSDFDDKGTKKRVRYYCHPGAYYKPLKLRKFKGSELSKEIQSFNNDAAKSDDFEVGYYPHMDAAGIHGTHIYKFYDRENKTISAPSMNTLVCYSCLAICVYNMEENTYFDNVKVLKAMTYCAPGARYNITFEASLPDNTTKIFQTRIFTSIPLPYAKIEIVFVRVKPN